jgi:cyclophilin family peptidyl-prolyl cis-trans isomerase
MLRGRFQRGLSFEPLETRNMLAVTLDPTGLLSSQTWTSPDGKYLYLPLNSTDDDSSATITYSASSSDSSLDPQVIQGGSTLVLNVSGQDSSGNAFSGNINIQMFGTLTPETVAHIVSLVNQNPDFYNSLDFFRVTNLGSSQDPTNIAQTGSTSNNGVGGSTLGPVFDEYTPELTFNSPALVAMANSGHNTSDSQFFLTDTNLGTSYESQGDYQYTIFGQVTSGFDILNDIMTTPVTGSTPNTPVVINSATVITDNQDAVLQIAIPAGYTNTSQIQVTANDSDGNSANTTFNVQGAADTVADTPFFSPPFGTSAPFTINPATPTTPTLSTPENSAITFTVPVTDTNVNPTLKPTLFEYDSNDGLYDLTPTDATATYSVAAGSGSTYNLTVTITPTTGFAGTANLQLRLTDNIANDSGGPDYENFSLNVTDNPVVTNNAGLVTTVGSTSVITTSLLQSTDPNYTASQLTYELSTTPADGTLDVNGTPLSGGGSFTQSQIDSGEVTYVSTGLVPASDSFEFTVLDGADRTSALSTFNITVNAADTPPVLTTNAGLTVSQGTSGTITTSQLQVTDTDKPDAQLTFTVVTAPTNGTLSDNGTGLAVGDTFTQADIDAGKLSYTNTGGTSDSFAFSVSDGDGGSIPSTSFAITVTGAVPVLATNTGLTVSQGATATITTSQLQVTDTAKSDSQLTFTVVTAPTNGALSDNGLALIAGSTFTQADIDAGDLKYANIGGTSDSFVFNVSDGDGGTIPNTTFAITVTTSVPAAPSSVKLDSGSDTGQFNNDDYTSDDSPQINITAAAGDTVTLQMNGHTVATATGGSNGQYTAILPAGDLAVGSNSITATVTNSNGTSTSSTPLVMTYAPDYSQVYTVPGVPGTAETLSLDWLSRNASYNDEIGVYVVSSLSGTAGGVAPGSSGYSQAAIGASSSQVVFASGSGGGASDTIQVTGGELLGFYMIQNSSTASFLSGNPSDSLSSGPKAFFTVTAANPDSAQHVQVIANPTTGQVQLNWEDMTGGGDSDFNDVVMTVTLVGGPTGTPGALLVPGGGNNSVTASATLEGGSLSSAPGDLGYYFVTDASGDIGSLAPGSPGYAAAALASSNSGVLFGSGQATGGVASQGVPAGSLVAFYAISSGTTSAFLASNPSNSTSGGAVAFFSFAGANPDGTDHFRFTSPEGVSTNPSQLQLHIMDKLFGNDSNYDSLYMNLNIGS